MDGPNPIVDIYSLWSQLISSLKPLTPDLSVDSTEIAKAEVAKAIFDLIKNNEKTIFNQDQRNYSPIKKEFEIGKSEIKSETKDTNVKGNKFSKSNSQQNALKAFVNTILPKVFLVLKANNLLKNPELILKEDKKLKEEKSTIQNKKGKNFSKAIKNKKNPEKLLKGQSKLKEKGKNFSKTEKKQSFKLKKVASNLKENKINNSISKKYIFSSKAQNKNNYELKNSKNFSNLDKKGNESKTTFSSKTQNKNYTLNSSNNFSKPEKAQLKEESNVKLVFSSIKEISKALKALPDNLLRSFFTGKNVDFNSFSSKTYIPLSFPFVVPFWNKEKQRYLKDSKKNFKLVKRKDPAESGDNESEHKNQ